jgi:hypothetical protein
VKNAGSSFPNLHSFSESVGSHILPPPTILFERYLLSRLNRHRDATGQEERERNDTLVGTLRAEYGEKFAPKFSEKMQLGTLKERLGLPLDASLNDVLRHFRIKD